jgi:multiple sugar transport system ATP-binding protein
VFAAAAFAGLYAIHFYAGHGALVLAVAGFIGSPAMNLVAASVVGAGHDDRIAGFRPEHVDLGNGRPDCVHCGAHVEVVEYLGDEQLVHLRVGDAAVQAKLRTDERVSTGGTFRSRLRASV